jgi:hypothetical protein
MYKPCSDIELSAGGAKLRVQRVPPKQSPVSVSFWLVAGTKTKRLQFIARQSPSEKALNILK